MSRRSASTTSLLYPVLVELSQLWRNREDAVAGGSTTMFMPENSVGERHARIAAAAAAAGA
eukprot:scaffold7353_cov234-Pinguiococcus_pyrenoidosus.AAC.3